MASHILRGESLVNEENVGETGCLEPAFKQNTDEYLLVSTVGLSKI